MGVCYDKGTFDIVDLPPGISELPSMFQYKLKLCPNGEFVECKARTLSTFEAPFSVPTLTPTSTSSFSLGISHSLGKWLSSEKVSMA
eukprot:3941452-Rhodomonas_salina.1